MINKGKYWKPEPEVWDEKKCAKVAKKRGRDGYGTRHPYPGLVQASGAVGGYGKTKYNGGCVRDGDWWEGEDIPFPVIPKEYCYVYRSMWGTYLMRREDAEKQEVEIID